MNNTPKGWHLSGGSKENYQIGLDDKVKYQGEFAGFITSTIESDGFGTLMQNFKPTNDYLNKHLKLTAFIKTKEVSRWAGLWLRIDGPNDQDLGFDNMQDRPILSTTEWTSYTIELAIPAGAVNIAFGTLLVGKGSVWIDEVTFEVKEIPKDAIGPLNLDFEESSTE